MNFIKTLPNNKIKSDFLIPKQEIWLSLPLISVLQVSLFDRQQKQYIHNFPFNLPNGDDVGRVDGHLIDDSDAAN